MHTCVFFIVIDYLSDFTIHTALCVPHTALRIKASSLEQLITCQTLHTASCVFHTFTFNSNYRCPLQKNSLLDFENSTPLNKRLKVGQPSRFYAVDRQTDRLTVWQTNGPTDQRTDTPINWRTDGLKDQRTHTRTDWWTEGPTDQQADGLIDGHSLLWNCIYVTKMLELKTQ